MLALAIGLIAGQAISAVLLYRAAEQRRDTALVNSIALQLVMSEHHEAMEMADRPGRALLREVHGADRLAHARLDPQFRMRIEESERNPLGEGEERIEHFEHDLHEVLETQGVFDPEILVTERLAREDRFIASRPRPEQRRLGKEW